MYLPSFPRATRLLHTGQFLCCSKILYNPKRVPAAAIIEMISICVCMLCVVWLGWCGWLMPLFNHVFPPVASIGIFRYIPQIFPATMGSLFANLISVPHPVFSGGAISFLFRFTAFFTSFTSFHPFGVDILRFFTPFFLPFFALFGTKHPHF